MKFKVFMFVIGAVLFPFAAQANQVLTMVENKRLEATICADSMNRIAVANDRITQIFGDEGTFETQNDETTGQIFLKPTVENGTKSLSLTLITEQGLTQDLTLRPTAKMATTMILKAAQSSAQQVSQNQSFPQKEVGFALGTERNSSHQDQVLEVLKQAVMGRLPLLEDQSPSRVVPEGFNLTHLDSYLGGPFIIHVYYVRNTTETEIEIHEKMFYRPGDLALSFQGRILPNDSKTRMYVVTMGGAHHD
jgi:type-F conjugative transfer system secretin TraK